VISAGTVYKGLPEFTGTKPEQAKILKIIKHEKYNN